MGQAAEKDLFGVEHKIPGVCTMDDNVIYSSGGPSSAPTPDHGTPSRHYNPGKSPTSTVAAAGMCELLGELLFRVLRGEKSCVRWSVPITHRIGGIMCICIEVEDGG